MCWPANPEKAKQFCFLFFFLSTLSIWSFYSVTHWFGFLAMCIFKVISLLKSIEGGRERGGRGGAGGWGERMSTVSGLMPTAFKKEFYICSP